MAVKGKVGIIATFTGAIDEVRDRFKIDLPGVQAVVFVDESMLAECLANKGHTPAVTGRLCTYFRNAESFGCDSILIQCSSIGEAASIAAQTVSIPVFKIDYPMAQEAVSLGAKIAVISTAISTVGPSGRLVEQAAREMGKAVAVRNEYVENAFSAILSGDKATHDELVCAKIRKAAKENDVIVLAQGSLFRLVPQVADVKIPIISSTISGVAQLKSFYGIE